MQLSSIYAVVGQLHQLLPPQPKQPKQPHAIVSKFAE
jgi:hypothetical protein